MRLKIGILAVLCLIFGRARGLSVGDRVPGLVVKGVLNNRSNTLDLRGKFVVLDFWATNCASCIRGLPGLQALRERFGDRLLVLPVSEEPAATVRAFLARNPLGRALRLPVVAGDTALADLFPHRILSHEVWIDTAGVVSAITEPEYVNAANVGAWLAGRQLELPVKNDLPDFDAKASFLNTGLDIAVLPFRQGVRPAFGVDTDFSAGVVRSYAVNFPLLQLYKLALGHLAYYPKALTLVKVRDSALLFVPAGMYRSRWLLRHGWCFESRLPLGTSDSARRAAMRLALDLFFGLHGRMERRQALCWVLRRTDSLRSWATAGGTPLNRLHSGTGEARRLQNASLDNLVWELNELPGGLPALNETGITTNVDMVLPVTDFQDQAALNRALARYGLTLERVLRRPEFLVVTDQ